MASMIPTYPMIHTLFILRSYEIERVKYETSLKPKSDESNSCSSINEVMAIRRFYTGFPTVICIDAMGEGRQCDGDPCM